MAGSINNNGSGGIRSPGQTPVQGQHQPTDVRQSAVKKGQTLDAQRAAQSAGFVRQPTTSEGKLNLGDYGRAPIPLDPGDVDPKAWNQTALKQVTEHLTLKSAKFKEIAENVKGGDSFAASLLSGLLGRPDRALSRWTREGQLDAGGEQVSGGDKAIAFGLEDAAATKAATAALNDLDLSDLKAHLSQVFGIDLATGGSDVGQSLLAAGLVVAGKSDRVTSRDGHMDEPAFLEGLREALDKGKDAIHEFEQMHSKINRQVNVQRTFMFKR